VESLGGWFRRPDAQVSSHSGIDDDAVANYVAFDRQAWTTRSANPISDSVELCGFAKWTRDEWMQHGRMLELCAQWIRDRCTARGIPIRKLSPADVAAGKPGVCGHVDWTVGMKDGTHTDPGPNFVWDHVIALASGGGAAPASGPDSLPTLKQGDSGPAVRSLQDWSNRFGWKPPLPLLTVDGQYGPKTTAVVKAAQAQCGVTGPDAIGTPVGPRTKRAFWSRGWRG
jgi:hypothetical protein